MSNAIEDTKTKEKQVKKYIVAKEILDDLLSKEYSEEVWSELDSCKEKVNNLEPVYFDFAENRVSKVHSNGVEIKIESKTRNKFLNEQSGELLDFLIRYPEERELNWLYHYFFSTEKQRNSKIIRKPEDARSLFVNLISNTMNSLKKCKVQIFEYDSSKHKHKSDIWKIQEGRKMFYSNIQESSNYYNQASSQFDQEEYDDAYNNAKKAFEKDSKNIEACLLIINILLADEFKPDTDQKKINSFRRTIIRTLEKEIKRYEYFINKVHYYKRKNNEKFIDIFVFLLGFIGKFAEIKDGLYKIKKEIDKTQLEVSGVGLLEDSEIQGLIKKRDIILDKKGINEDKIIDFLSEPIFTNILRDIAVSLSEWEKTSSDINDIILDLRYSLFIEYAKNIFDIKKISADLVLTKEYINYAAINSEFFKEQKKKHIKPRVVNEETKAKSRIAKIKAEIQNDKQRDNNRG